MAPDLHTNEYSSNKGFPQWRGTRRQSAGRYYIKSYIVEYQRAKSNSFEFTAVGINFARLTVGFYAVKL